MVFFSVMMGVQRFKSFSTFVFTAASILMGDGQGRLKTSAGRFFVAAMPSLQPMAILLVAWSSTSDERLMEMLSRRGSTSASRRGEFPAAAGLHEPETGICQ